MLNSRLFVSDTSIFSGLILVDPHSVRATGENNVSIDDICVHDLKTHTHRHKVSLSFKEIKSTEDVGLYVFERESAYIVGTGLD